MALGTGVAFRPTVAANRQSSYCRVEYSGSKSSSALSFVKVQKTVKSRGDVMEDGAIVLPDVFTASAAFVSANRFPRQRAQRT